MGTGFFCVNISFTGSSLWVFIFALFCCYHILEIPFTLGTSAVMWSLQTSLQLVVILDKYCGSSWVHLNPLHWCFHKEIILSKLFHLFFHGRQIWMRKATKALFTMIRLPSKESLPVSNTPQQLLLIFLTLTYFQSCSLSIVIHTSNPSTGEVEATGLL